MNNRPLTTVSSVYHDDEPSMPNHFLLGRPTNITPTGILATRNSNQDRNCNWRVLQQLINSFRERFLEEISPKLTTRSKSTNSCQKLEVGDLAWMLKDFTPRRLWPMERVKSAIVGSGDAVRSFEISTVYGTFTRPVNRLATVLDDL